MGLFFYNEELRVLIINVFPVSLNANWVDLSHDHVTGPDRIAAIFDTERPAIQPLNCLDNDMSVCGIV